MGATNVPPMLPMFETVMVGLANSAGVSVPVRARWDKEVIWEESSGIVRVETFWRTGTRRPVGVSIARAMLWFGR